MRDKQDKKKGPGRTEDLNIFTGQVPETSVMETPLFPWEAILVLTPWSRSRQKADKSNGEEGNGSCTSVPEVAPVRLCSGKGKPQATLSL